MMEGHRLPSHHQLYTALIPPSPPPAFRSTSNIANDPSAAEPTNDEPSSAKVSNWRRQLLTLHVIFPSLLLPALDLLDRGLVTRLLVVNSSQTALEEAASPTSSTLEDSITKPTEEESTSHVFTSPQGIGSKDQICMYSVQSAASTTSRRGRHMLQASKTYAVHLDAWSCSCGTFALDAYSNHDVTNNADQLKNSTSSEGFGYLGLDGRLGLRGDFPCCKHLLACLLAEKWRGAPRGHVEDKYITKEELAAIIGGP